MALVTCCWSLLSDMCHEQAPLMLQGNLCWEAALEVTLAAKSVHAPVMDPTNKVMDAEWVLALATCASDWRRVAEHAMLTGALSCKMCTVS